MQLMDGVIDNRNMPLLSLLVFEKVPCSSHGPSDRQQFNYAKSRI
jgi:hypothetical protein